MSFSMQDFLTPQITAVSYRGEEVHDTHPATSTMLTAPCAMTRQTTADGWHDSSLLEGGARQHGSRLPCHEIT